MGVDNLEQAEGNPEIDGNHVKITRRADVYPRSTNGTNAQNDDFQRVRILCCQTEGCTVFVMDLVNVLVQSLGVESLVSCKTKRRRFVRA